MELEINDDGSDNQELDQTVYNEKNNAEISGEDLEAEFWVK